MNKFADLWEQSETRYMIVGGWNTIVAWIIFTTIQIFFVPPMSNTGSVLLTYLISMLNSYIMQRIFVWKSQYQVLRELPKFIIVSATQLLLNVVLIRFFVDHMSYPAIATQFVVTVFLVCSSYVALKKWTFSA